MTVSRETIEAEDQYWRDTWQRAARAYVPIAAFDDAPAVLPGYARCAFCGAAFLDAVIGQHEANCELRPGA